MIGKPGAGGKRQIICPLKISALGGVPFPPFTIKPCLHLAAFLLA
jgi:hypothetical protein